LFIYNIFRAFMLFNFQTQHQKCIKKLSCINGMKSVWNADLYNKGRVLE